MRKIPSNSVDAVVTDPPYGFAFMKKKWDTFGANLQNYQEWVRQWARQALRVLKPGGWLLSFGGARTYHRMVCGIEDAGFEIRDCIMWVYGSGFPKSLNIAKSIDRLIKEGVASLNRIGDDSKGRFGYAKFGFEQGYRPKDYMNVKRRKYEITEDTAKQWSGWGTALKPAVELIVVARKPLSEKNVALNVLKWGTGGLNIDECRIGNETITAKKRGNAVNTSFMSGGFTLEHQGRFPANLLLECVCDEVIEGKEIGKESGYNFENSNNNNPVHITHNIKSGVHFKDKQIIHTNPECPCYMLDKQSGIRKSGSVKGLDGHKEGFVKGAIEQSYEASQGGASRFFKQINFKNYCSLCYNTCTKVFNEEDKIWRQLFVNNAEKNLRTTRATTESIAQENVPLELKLKLAQIVKYVGNLCDLCVINFVQEVVKIKHLDFNPEELEVTQGFIQNSKKYILLQNLVQFVEQWDNIDTTPTTKNLLKLLGSVNRVTTNYIQEIEKSEPKRFLYQPKASRSERDMGLERNVPFNRSGNPTFNYHPTIKPIRLMEYLVKLVTPPNGVVLDPFAGSGSTLIACKKLGFRFIGIEKERDYIEITKGRLNAFQPCIFERPRMRRDLMRRGLIRRA